MDQLHISDARPLFRSCTCFLSGPANVSLWRLQGGQLSAAGAHRLHDSRCCQGAISGFSAQLLQWLKLLWLLCTILHVQKSPTNKCEMLEKHHCNARMSFWSIQEGQRTWFLVPQGSLRFRITVYLRTKSKSQFLEGKKLCQNLQTQELKNFRARSTVDKSTRLLKQHDWFGVKVTQRKQTVSAPIPVTKEEPKQKYTQMMWCCLAYDETATLSVQHQWDPPAAASSWKSTTEQPSPSRPPVSGEPPCTSSLRWKLTNLPFMCALTSCRCFYWFHWAFKAILEGNQLSHYSAQLPERPILELLLQKWHLSWHRVDAHSLHHPSGLEKKNPDACFTENGGVRDFRQIQLWSSVWRFALC